MLKPLTLGGERMQSRSAFASGAALHNVYLTPIQGASPMVVTNAPGLRRWGRIPFIPGGGLLTANPGIQGLVSIDTPTYGRRIFGLSSGYQFFEMRFGGGDVNDPPADYQPFRATSPSPLYVATARRVHTFSLSAEAIGPVRMVADTQRIFWAIGRDVFMWDMAANGAEGAFHSILAPTAMNASATLPDEEWVDVAWIDGYFFLAARNGELFHSLLNSPDFDQLDLAKAVAKPDPIVGLGTLQRRLYIFGTRSIEQWFHRPRGVDFAFTRDNSWVADIGAASRATIQPYEEGICFLGSDGMVYKIRGYTLERLSNEDIDREILASDMSQARAVVYTEAGHRFYSLILHYPPGISVGPDHVAGTPRNWTFDLTTTFWHTRRATNVNVLTRFRGRNYLGMDNSDGLVSQQVEWGRELGTSVERSFVTPIVYAGSQRYRLMAVQFNIKTLGAGTVQLAKSLDGGRSWENVGAPKALDRHLLIWSGANDADAADMERLLNENQLNLRLTFTGTNMPLDLSNLFIRTKRET